MRSFTDTALFATERERWLRRRRSVLRTAWRRRRRRLLYLGIVYDLLCIDQEVWREQGRDSHLRNACSFPVSFRTTLLWTILSQRRPVWSRFLRDPTPWFLSKSCLAVRPMMVGVLEGYWCSSFHQRDREGCWSDSSSWYHRLPAACLQARKEDAGDQQPDQHARVPAVLCSPGRLLILPDRL